MTLAELQTYIVSKNPTNPKYDKTTKDKVIKVNKEQVVTAEDLKLDFDPQDRESVKVQKATLVTGQVIIVKERSFS